MDSGQCSTGHAIVGGCGHLGSRIAYGLLERSCRVVVIDKCPDDSLASRLEAAGCTVLRGDVRDEETLDRAGIASAACYIAATGDDRANLESAVTARQRSETCTVVARLYDQTLSEQIEKAFHIRALSASFLAAPAYVSAATDDSVISALTIDGCCLSIHSAPTGPARSHGHYVTVSENGIRLSADASMADGCFFAAVHSSSRQLYSKRPRRRKKPAHNLSSILAGLNPAHMLRELANTWKHAPVITKRLTVALLAVSILSVVVFWTAGRMSPLDAIYFVVTTMTTVGYGDFNLQHAPTGLKVFGVLMMLSGAALLATVYAIIADRVLAARVEYLLGRKRVSLHGHTIVVGLGKVGYRVARALDSLGVSVVGVEAVEDSDNVSSAKSLFPVVVGDASRASILHKAAVDNAETVLALTDDPLLNLSVALSAREHNPCIRTIVRTYDIGLAEKLSSFGLDMALSTSAIAAPSFVDAAIYPGIQGSFPFAGEDILAARYAIGSGSPLLGKTPSELGEKLGVAVIAVSDAARTDYHPADPAKPLIEGQRVLTLLTRAAVSKV